MFIKLIHIFYYIQLNDIIIKVKSNRLLFLYKNYFKVMNLIKVCVLFSTKIYKAAFVL